MVISDTVIKNFKYSISNAIEQENLRNSVIGLLELSLRYVGTDKVAEILEKYYKNEISEDADEDFEEMDDSEYELFKSIVGEENA